MIPFIPRGPQVRQLDQRSDAGEKHRIISTTGAHIVFLSLIGEQRHFEILFRLRPVVAPIHIALVAPDQESVKKDVLC